MISTLTCYLGNWYLKPVGSSIDNKYTGSETFVIPEGIYHARCHSKTFGLRVSISVSDRGKTMTTRDALTIHIPEL